MLPFSSLLSPSQLSVWTSETMQDLGRGITGGGGGWGHMPHKFLVPPRCPPQKILLYVNQMDNRKLVSPWKSKHPPPPPWKNPSYATGPRDWRIDLETKLFQPFLGVNFSSVILLVSNRLWPKGVNYEVHVYFCFSFLDKVIFNRRHWSYYKLTLFVYLKLPPESKYIHKYGKCLLPPCFEVTYYKYDS